jgi:sugar phosphate isomerase/epimerase
MKPSQHSIIGVLLVAFLSLSIPGKMSAADQPSTPAPVAVDGLFEKTNLVAWCIVPFDGKKRGPEERAAMLEQLGITKFAYDYRAEHVPTFDAEIEALQKHNIELTAWWFPTSLNGEAEGILEVLKRHHEHPQLWVMGGGEPTTSPDEQAARVKEEAGRIGKIAIAAKAIGSTVGLYNHGGWFGDPENQIAVIERLNQFGIMNVGIVYNLHHGHEHLDRFPALLEKMKPYLLVLNINGMTGDADQIDLKILPVGQGNLDLKLLTIIRDSGWHGPIGILNHTDEDAEVRLNDNLAGLAWLAAQLNGQTVGAKPTPVSWKQP